jgi:deoxyribodipyrimidine photo-lyase
MESALVWLRRDLRLDDNTALSAALQAAERVYCAFVFDTDILDSLPERADRRVAFIHGSVAANVGGLAVERRRGHGRPALVPHLQPGDPVAAV